MSLGRDVRVYFDLSLTAGEHEEDRLERFVQQAKYRLRTRLGVRMIRVWSAEDADFVYNATTRETDDV